MTPSASIYYSALSLALLPSGISNNPMEPMPPLLPLPRPTCSSSSYLSAMTQALRSYYHGQNTTTHITDHIHQSRRRRSLCKIKLDDWIFLDWFLKSLLPIIAKDVASERPQSEEEAILKSQQFDLIYAQSGYLYTIYLTPLTTIPPSTIRRGHPTLPTASLAVSPRSLNHFP